MGLPAGTFKMGSPVRGDSNADDNEKPQHWVRLTQDFYMSRYEVTNAQYAAFLNAEGIGSNGQGSLTYDYNGTPTTETLTFVYDCTKDNRSQWGIKWNTDKWEPVSGYGDHPVIYVTWYGAKAYADYLGAALPTEAQWEYACRAGTETIYSYGDAANGEYMWYSSNSSSQTHKVGTKKPNPWGLFDMHGNVLELCLDQWDESYNYPTADTEDVAISDPLVTTGSYRVLRGGGWSSIAKSCRSAFRSSNLPGFTDNRYGFRVVFVP